MYTLLGAYFAISLVVALVFGIKDAKRGEPKDSISLDLFIGLMWPFAFLGYVSSWFGELCMWICKKIDEFNEVEAKKRVQKPEGRINGK